LSFGLADEEPLPFVKNLSRAQSARWVAWNAQLRGAHALALDRWNAQPYPPETTTELAAIAVTMISQGDPRAPALIERLRDLEPIEADTLSALLTLRDGDQKLAAMYCERALLGLRQDPFEPYAPWTQRFLAVRAKAYDDANHPLARAAERDLKRYDAQQE
jgi:hypothetical protein